MSKLKKKKIKPSEDSVEDDKTNEGYIELVFHKLKDKKIDSEHAKFFLEQKTGMSISKHTLDIIKQEDILYEEFKSIIDKEKQTRRKYTTTYDGIYNTVIFKDN